MPLFDSDNREQPASIDRPNRRSVESMHLRVLLSAAEAAINDAEPTKGIDWHYAVSEMPMRNLAEAYKVITAQLKEQRQ